MILGFEITALCTLFSCTSVRCTDCLLHGPSGAVQKCTAVQPVPGPVLVTKADGSGRKQLLHQSVGNHSQ